MNTMKRVLVAAALAGAALTMTGTAQAADPPRERLSSFLTASDDGVWNGQDYDFVQAL
ncbi:hypothetical protein [Streptomyces vinaceus]|uniref:hypothetical protein n=1 Tax=Streptomyces vinaceus TaxID=1960 RepID=UPI0036C1E9B9